MTDSWKQIHFEHPDITAIEIQGSFGTLQILNIYNNCNNNSSLTHISMYMRDRDRQQCTNTPLLTAWMGDFNRHHPLWDEPQNTHLFTTNNLELTQPLLNMLGRHNMKMALPALIPTLRSHSTGNHTQVDNVFCTENLVDSIIKCNTDDAARPIKIDHYPIVMQIDIHTPKTAWEPRRNFCLTDWTEFGKTLKSNLANLPMPTEIADVETFNSKLKTLNDTIQDTIMKHVKLMKPSPYMKRWWTSELMTEKKKTQQLGGRSKYHHLNGQHPIHEEYQQQHNQYSELLCKTKAEHWAQWIEGVDESSIWDMSRLMTSPASDAGRSRIPTLQIKDPTTKRII
jgi:hypothetical protein